MLRRVSEWRLHTRTGVWPVVVREEPGGFCARLAEAHPVHGFLEHRADDAGQALADLAAVLEQLDDDAGAPLVETDVPHPRRPLPEEDGPGIW